MSKSCIFLLFSLLLLSYSVDAQSPVDTNSGGPKTGQKPLADKGDKAAKTAAAERLAQERRTQARALLISLAIDARTFRDSMLRSRSLARIADALWPVDSDQARLLFRKAWEAADVANQERAQRIQDEVRKQKAVTGGGFAMSLPPDVRREVLKLAARRDRALGEEFLEKLNVQKQEEAKTADHAKRGSVELGEGAAQRLDLAREFLFAGDIERALQFADAALGVVNMASIGFLVELREKSPSVADQRYAAMLAGASMNPRADANTVSLLFSYIFTPHLYATFGRGGVSSSQRADYLPPIDGVPQLRMAFLQTAAGILLRPQPTADQEQDTAGVEGKYLVLKRLLPFFEQFTTRDLVAAVRGQLEVLNSLVSDGVRVGNAEWARRGIEPEKPAADQEQAVLDKIDRARTSEERDRLYVNLAFIVMNRADMRARDFVSKIEDTELRKKAQAYVDASLAVNSVGRKLIEQALELARKGELTHIQRVWVLTQCATQLFKTDPEKALALAEEAMAEVLRIDGSDPSRPRGLIAVANIFKLVDPGRIWDAAFDAVKAANSAEGFSGEDGNLTLQFQSKGQSSVNNNDVPEFDLEGIFRELATRDYERAVGLARGFQGEGPRAIATIAIARAVLEQRPAAAMKAQD